VLTRDQIEAMTAEERVELFDRMMGDLYGSTGTTACNLFARDFDMHQQTPYKWRAKPETNTRGAARP
jgi:hypothetical protein